MINVTGKKLTITQEKVNIILKSLDWLLLHIYKKKEEIIMKKN